MDIVLDSNIFRSDFLMNSMRFQLVFDYLKKTNSEIIVPQIVYQEIIALYERELKERFEKFKRCKENLEGISIGKIKQDFIIDLEEEVERYADFFKDKLKIRKEDIVPYKDSYLGEIVKRSVDRIKPCSDNGKEFRDVLLWLTVLDIAKSPNSKEAILISNNTHEFSSDGVSLHPVLLDEAKQAGLSIKYFKSLDQFIEAHAVKIEFITREWLKSELSIEKVDKLILRKLEKYDEERLLEWAEDREDARTTGYFNPITPNVDIDDFYIYEKTDGSYYVEIAYCGEVEIEFEFEYEEDYDDEIFRYRTQTKTKCLYKEISVTFGIEIKDKKISDYEIIDWEL